MSVLCLHLPNFLITLACRHEPALAGGPLALVGPDERVWAVAPPAAQGGVQVQMRPQEAQFACPEVILRPVAMATVQETQDAFLAQAATWQLPVEPQAWGLAYLDLHTVAKTSTAVQPLAAEMGRLVRGALGVSLQPAIGWDSGKFTARVAALQAPPGRMRLVDQADEVRFLRPLPISLLPLPRQHLQQLHWLGVRTLGQFAALPVAAVWQRFGTMGKVAQRWAQGHDDRPVRACVAHAPAAIVLAFDPPEARLQPVVEALLAALQTVLGAMVANLEGLRRLRLALGFGYAGERICTVTFAEPASQLSRVRAALVQHLSAVRWPASLEQIVWTVLETGELVAPQLTLFDDPPQQLLALDAAARQLAERYGPSFFKASMPEEQHPLPERRSHFAAFGPVSL